MSTLPPDHAVREEALNPEESFIVQAPAGSGKTHLLIQRYLRLLAGVEEPEQIIAITFTVKAAAEMRERVLTALNKARDGHKPTKPHEVSMAELAEAAVARDAERGWDLEHFPARLRITTIDALNSKLCSAAPLIAGGLSLNAVTDTPDAIYRQTARRLLNLMTDSSEEGDAVRRLLSHLDNNIDRFETLVCAMLSQREQWLPVIGTGAALSGQRHELEACLDEIVTHELEHLEQLVPFEVRPDLLRLLDGAAEVLIAENRKNYIALWTGRPGFPKAQGDDLPVWKQLADALLTNDDEWRSARGITVARGFVAKTKEKDQFIAVLDSLRDSAELEAALGRVRALPAPRLSDEQWATLTDLLMLLPLSVAQLKLSFAESGETDFPEIAAEARAALGHEDAPSDLALAMDCRLQHILMDEFQDTSVAQADLLGKLTMGWQPGDGHTLFIVGDPMQSIYRFRQAEVGLFLSVARNGIGQIQPKAVRLTANFRSTPTVVNWVNRAFSVIMPEEDDPTTGAVSFSPGEAVKAEDPASEVSWFVQKDKSKDEEAHQVVDLVQRLLKQNDEQSVGILVRSRSHAASIAPMLREAGIGFAGTDLEYMSEVPVVQDLVALTRALLHPADRLAWTALLRGPWCGLTLADLNVVLSADRKASVWGLMKQSADSDTLSADGRARLQRFVRLLGDGYRRRGRLALCDWIEGVWLTLAGPVASRGPDDLLAARAYFQFLEEQTVGDDVPDTAELLELLAQKPVSFSSPSARVQIMTIHKSKGLEFDSVILPGLGRRSRGNDKQVLLWKEIVRPNGEPGLLLAPIDRAGEDTDPLYSLISDLDKQQDAEELSRLLYVATTRAKERLYLFAEFHLTDEGEVKQADKGTLAACMHEFVQAAPEIPIEPPDDGDDKGDVPADEGGDWVQPLIKRLPVGWSLPQTETAVATANRFEIAVPLEPVTFDWAGTLARHVGTVVHDVLEQVAKDNDQAEQLSADSAQHARRLIDQGVAEADLKEGLERVQAALGNTLGDERGKWIVNSSHADAASELPVTVWERGRPVQRVIDRTFIDDKGDRWIIDYKTSSHSGGGLEAFLDNEVERYREQLQAYKAALTALYPESEAPVRLGLYFPALAEFREVDDQRELS